MLTIMAATISLPLSCPAKGGKRGPKKGSSQGLSLPTAGLPTARQAGRISKSRLGSASGGLFLGFDNPPQADYESP